MVYVSRISIERLMVGTATVVLMNRVIVDRETQRASWLPFPELSQPQYYSELFLKTKKEKGRFCLGFFYFRLRRMSAAAAAIMMMTSAPMAM